MASLRREYGTDANIDRWKDRRTWGYTSGNMVVSEIFMREAERGDKGLENESKQDV